MRDRDEVEEGETTPLYWVMQKYAAHIGKSNPDLATRLHAIAREIARDVELSDRIREREYHCMFCDHGRANPPETRCQFPWGHVRADGSRYVEVPRPLLPSAARTFGGEHFGLPWFESCEADHASDSIVVFTRAQVPDGAMPTTWHGYTTISRPVRRRVGAPESIDGTGSSSPNA